MSDLFIGILIIVSFILIPCLIMSSKGSIESEMCNMQSNQITVYIFNPHRDEAQEINTTIYIDYDDASGKKTAQISFEGPKILSLGVVVDSSFKNIEIEVAAEPGIVRQNMFTDDYFVWYEHPNVMQAKEALYNSIRQDIDWEIAQHEQYINKLKELIDRAERILT